VEYLRHWWVHLRHCSIHQPHCSQLTFISDSNPRPIPRDLLRSDRLRLLWLWFSVSCGFRWCVPSEMFCISTCRTFNLFLHLELQRHSF
jgi:hypothetical protein